MMPEQLSIRKVGQSPERVQQEAKLRVMRDVGRGPYHAVCIVALFAEMTGKHHLSGLLES
jgi:hypothetical protein